VGRGGWTHGCEVYNISLLSSRGFSPLLLLLLLLPSRPLQSFRPTSSFVDGRTHVFSFSPTAAPDRIAKGCSIMSDTVSSDPGIDLNNLNYTVLIPYDGASSSLRPTHTLQIDFGQARP